MAVSFSSLRAQLENEKSSLFKIDENIKKIHVSGRSFSNDRLAITLTKCNLSVLICSDVFV